ncbi:hypothetical protein OAO01_07960 [Oligoflexia bacterium]|nr:hypothetical protein [Oligoflexia bacterium]
MGKKSENGSTDKSEVSADRQRWERARQYLIDLDKIPTSFTTPVRTLLLDGKHGGVLSPASQFLTTRLLKSPTMKAIFYYLTLALHGEKISNSAYLSSSDLVRLYAPHDVAAIIAIIYLHKKITRKGRLAEDADWANITKVMMIDVELGGHLGEAIPGIGPMKGILAASLRQMMLGIFRIDNNDEFQRYLQHLRLNNTAFDLNLEQEIWGCTHLDLGSNALQMLGFGARKAHAFLTGCSANPPKDPRHDQEAYEFNIAVEWIETLKATGAAPDRVHLGQYYPAEKQMHKLLYEVNEIQEKGSEFAWLTRSKDDINPQATPQLYQEFLMELQGTEVLEEFYKDNLPSEVLQDLSEEDLRELAEAEVESS